MRLKGNVTIAKRRNRDKSITFYLRWHTERYGGGWCPHSERLFRTEAKPTLPSLTEWRRKAMNAVATRAAEFEGREVDDRDARERHLVPLPTAIEHYSVWIRGDEEHAAPLAQSTANERERHLLGFMEFVGSNYPKTRNIWQLSHRHTYRWREHRRASGILDSTLAKECAHIQAFLDWCDSPARGWMRKKLYVLPQAERRQLHTQPRQHHIPSDKAVQKAAGASQMIFVLAATGIRQGELRDLRVNHWDMEENVLQIRPSGQERTKKHYRDVPVGPKLGGILNTISIARYGELPMFTAQNDMPMTSNEVHRIVKPFGFTSHDLRRWCMTKLIDTGCPHPYAMLLLGHTLPRQEAAYLPYTPEHGLEYMMAVEDALLP